MKCDSRLRERDQTHIIYIGSRFLKSYMQSSLPTSKENSLITPNCKPYIIKIASCALQEPRKPMQHPTATGSQWDDDIKE